VLVFRVAVCVARKKNGASVYCDEEEDEVFVSEVEKMMLSALFFFCC